MLCYRGTSFLALKDWGYSSTSGLMHLVGLIRVRVRLLNSWLEWCKWWYRTVCKRKSTSWCQRRILGMRWYDFLRNIEVSSRTALPLMSDRITMGRNVILVTWRVYQTALWYIRASRAFSRPTPRPTLETWKRPGVKLGGSHRISDPAPLVWDPLSLFYVTCCAESVDVFYDEHHWPDGVEVRDWVYKN